MGAIDDDLRRLVSSALDDLETGAQPLSRVVLRAARVARLRDDYAALWWLDMELRTYNDPEARKRAARELHPHFAREEWLVLNERYLDEHISERTIDTDKVLAFSVEEIENMLALMARDLGASEYPPSISSAEFAELSRSTIRVHNALDGPAMQHRAVLARIRARVHAFLSQTECQVRFGSQPNVFARNWEYVEQELGVVSEASLGHLRTAARQAAGSSEERSGALTCCRQALKTLADELYPARTEPVVGADGCDHEVTDAQYLNRLVSFVAGKLGETAGHSFDTAVADLAQRLERTNGLASKGVHEHVSVQEAEMCVGHLTMVIADVLRIRNGTSAYAEDLADVPAADAAAPPPSAPAVE